MKCTKFINLTAATLLLVVVTVGCKRNPQNTTPLLGRGQGPVGDDRSRMINDTAKIDDGPGIANAGNLKDLPLAAEQPAALRDNTVYFDYDRANVRASETSKLDAVASYIKGGANRPIRIEGHCDERGTAAYNLVLGEKRARAVKIYLQDLGVQASQLQITSYGEAKPFCKQSNENCYQQNRRAHFVTK